MKLAIALGIALILGSPIPGFSQSTSLAQLNGTVQDSTGAVIANASVTLQNLETNRVYTTASNNDRKLRRSQPAARTI